MMHIPSQRRTPPPTLSYFPERATYAATRPRTGACCLSLLVSLAGPGLLAAQARFAPEARQTGFRIEVSLAAGQSWLSDATQRYWEPAGNFGFGGGFGLALGYDASRVGFSATLDTRAAPIGNHPGLSAALALVADWRPDAVIFGSWRPLVTAGFVRQGIVADRIEPGETRDSMVPGGGSTEQRPVGVMGNGIRLGIAGERRVSRTLALTVGAGADLVSFGTLIDDGYGMSFPSPGLSVSPRIALALRWWPFSR